MTNEEAPCQTCGSPVRVREEHGGRTVADGPEPIMGDRICTNRDCPTNRRDKPFMAAV